MRFGWPPCAAESTGRGLGKGKFRQKGGSDWARRGTYSMAGIGLSHATRSSGWPRVLGGPFYYGDLGAEIKESDGLKIDHRGYAGALEAVAVNLHSTEPLWTCLVVNAQTGEPGDGLWKANPNDRRYADAWRLPTNSRAEWLRRQQDWCIAYARVQTDPLNQALREDEAVARDRAQNALVDILLADRRSDREGS
jgi:hypothetical protein